MCKFLQLKNDEIKMERYNKNNMNAQRGSSILETILAIALSLVLVPFIYFQISDMNNAVKDVAVANRIVKSQDKVIDFVRQNQGVFKVDGSDITSELNELDLDLPNSTMHSAWVFKNDATTEVYMAFTFDSEYKAANIAKYIGEDAAIVSNDNVAYAQNWAIGVSDDFNFYPGDLIFRISHDFGGEDRGHFLHRGSFGEDELNTMEQDLYMGNKDVQLVANITGDNLGSASAPIENLSVASMNIPTEISVNKVTALCGAQIKSENLTGFYELKVADGVDVSGFKKIYANKITKADGVLSSNPSLTANKVTVASEATIQDKLTVVGDGIARFKFFGASKIGNILYAKIGSYNSKAELQTLSNEPIIFTNNAPSTLTNNTPSILKINSWEYTPGTPARPTIDNVTVDGVDPKPLLRVFMTSYVVGL